MSSPARPDNVARAARSAAGRRDEPVGPPGHPHPAILDSVGSGIYAVDSDGRTTFVNPAAARMFGWNAEDLIGKRSHDVVHHSRPDGSLYPIEECPIYGTLADGVLREGDEVFWRRDGRGVPVQFVSAPIREGDRIVGAVFTFTDATARQRAEQALRESEERYRLAVEGVTDYGIFTLDPTGHVTSWNVGVERLLGYPESEFLGRDGRSIFTPEDIEARAPEEELGTALREGRAADQRWHVRRDGSRFWANGVVTPIRDEDGAVRGFSKVMHDETEQKRMEDGLRFLVEASRVLATSLDHETTLENVARLAVPAIADWCAIRLAADDGVPREIAYVHRDPAKLALLRELARRFPVDSGGEYGHGKVVATGEPDLVPELTDSMLEAIVKDREQLEMVRRLGMSSYMAVPVTVSGRHKGVISFASAESGRRYGPSDLALAQELARRAAVAIENAELYREMAQQRESTRESEERFRLLVESVRDYAIFMLDTEGRIASWNAGAERITGYSAAEVIGHHLSRFYMEEDITAGEPERELTIAAGEGRYEKEGWRVRKGGSRFWANVVVTAVRDRRGELLGFAKVTRDMTERRSLEEQLRQSQKMEAVGRLAGGIAHDFNNLLTAIMGYADLLLSDLAPEDPRREELDEIRKAADRATNLTRQLLAFGRRQVLSPKVLDLGALVTDMAPMLRRLIGEDIDLAISPAAEPVQVVIDPGQLEQVILNLVVNARDAMPDGGKLTVETDSVELDQEFVAEHLGVRPGPYVLLAVSDTGIGMDEETRLRLFEPFFTTKPQGRGTGLGLATVYGVVTQSGGAIWVYSEPGKGTTFKIYLPRVEAGERAAIPQRQRAIERGTETVLVVEDDPGVRALITGVLARHGYSVLDAPDSTQGLLVAGQHSGSIDLLVTDVVMPGSSGAVLAQRLRLERPGVKVLFISGYTDDAIVHHGVLEPGVAFLEKPFTPAALAAKVREVLEGRALSLAAQPAVRA